MAFQLCTFGALELRTVSGEPVAGAASQPKPLLILALAALTPGGVPRERLLQALWPGVDRERARATLKQHLYALRRATGEPDLVQGSPRLRINRDLLRVDALDFAEHVDHGRLREATALIRGELFEGLTRDPALRPELAEMIGDIRREYAARIALVREADAVKRATAAATNCTDVPPRVRAAEREIAAAARRFGQAMAALPVDAVAAYHRAVASSHDLLEALHEAERAVVPTLHIEELLREARETWLRSGLVRRMHAAAPGHVTDVESMEWLIAGDARTSDPVGRALEEHLLDSPLASQLRERISWQSAQIVTTTLATPDARILVIAPAGAGLAGALPVLEHSRATVVLNDADPDALALAAIRVAPLRERRTMIEGDCFRRMSELEAQGPYHLITVGTLLDGLHARAATWLIPRLFRMLTANGQVCVSSLATGQPFGAWLRHIVGWNLVERDQDEMVLLLGDAADRCELTWDNDGRGMVWRVTLRGTSREPRRVTRAAA